MLGLRPKQKAIGTTVRCPSCRHPNLGIDIWCERCGAPLDWTGTQRSSTAMVAPEPSPAAQASTPVATPPIAEGPTVADAPRPRRERTRPAFTLPKLAIPAIAWPSLRVPRWSMPRLRLPAVPRVPRLVWVVGAILALLLIVPLAYLLLPSGRAVASRTTASTRLPSTSGASAVGTPLAAAIPGVEAKTGLRVATGKCPNKTACLRVASQVIGQEAAAVVFSTAGSAGRQCAGYVYHSGGAWHFLDAACGLPGQLSPLAGNGAVVHVPGNCANVRNAPSLTAGVVACLKDGTAIRLDGGPTYAGGRLWWHEKDGWIAHDFLIAA
jgi:hypothetical protein